MIINTSVSKPDHYRYLRITDRSDCTDLSDEPARVCEAAAGSISRVPLPVADWPATLPCGKLHQNPV